MRRLLSDSAMWTSTEEILIITMPMVKTEEAPIPIGGLEPIIQPGSGDKFPVLYDGKSCIDDSEQLFCPVFGWMPIFHLDSLGAGHILEFVLRDDTKFPQ